MLHLGVFRDATPEEIKRAYFDAAQRLHPDKNVAPGETELFLEIQQAYEVLANPKRRNMYDATLPPEIEANTVVKYEVYFSRPNLVRLGEPQLLYACLKSVRAKKRKPSYSSIKYLPGVGSVHFHAGGKVDIVKATAIQLLRSCVLKDVLSVVSFSDRAEVIVPASVSPDKKKQEGRIQMMQASGATEIFNGTWKLGCARFAAL
jgi:Ca-activated chloride channel family protein